jgi:pimeloyl-ACP methyl ester carboxylesterase
MATVYSAEAQHVPYGSNPAAGKYVTIHGAKIYYEVYGEGRPVLLLHGDTFGYIDEFSDYIPILSKYFKVIAVGMRGHGKSELGHTPFTDELLAQDALAALNNETTDSAIVVGFSTGGTLAYYLAAYYPKRIRKVVAMAGALGVSGARQDVLNEQRTLTIEALEKKYPEFFKERKELMPQPDRYQELIDNLKNIWFEEYHVPPSKAKAITCAVLTVGGDRDDYYTIHNFVDIYQTIPNSQLAIIPNCGHVGLIERQDMFQ